MAPKERMKKALEIAKNYGSIDGGHHKMWVIDQMVRALTGCPIVEKSGTNYLGQPFTFKSFDESEEYKKWIIAHNHGEDGPATYEWETGTAP